MKVKYDPVFGIKEEMMPNIGRVLHGEKVSGILSFEVIEKTKSYLILKIGSLHITQKRRMA